MKFKPDEWEVTFDDINRVEKEMREMRTVKKIVRNIPTVSEPPVEAPFKKRRRIDMSKTKLAKYQTTKLLSPLADKDHSMRVDMFVNQFDNMVMPLKAEVPILSSALYGDMLSRSSCIHKARGKITLLHKIVYQYRKIYIYKLNDRIYLMDSNGYINTNGVCCIQKTDLDALEIGVEYDISDDDDNFCIEYPDQYDPTMDIVKYGVNLVMINTIDKDTVDDAAKLSDSALAKLGTIKMKTVNIALENKIIKSDFPDKIPELGKLLKTPVIFKIVEDEETVSSISQSTDTPVGLEDSQIIVEPNSYIGYFEVTANEPIENDPILERYRLEYLEFRQKVANALRPYVLYDRSNCDNKVIAFYENFSISKFRTEKKALTCPFIRMEIVTYDFGAIGCKFSNEHGCKATSQNSVYGGYLVAEDGTPIDMVFSVSAHIARSITGVLWEQWLTGMSMYLTRKYKTLTDKEEKKRLISDYREVLNIFDLEKAHKSFSDKDIDTILMNYPAIPIAIMPYEQRIDMESGSQAMRILSKWGYEEQTIWVCDRDGNRIRPLTDKHLVGSVYTIRDIHDPEYQNSSISEVTLTTKGIPEEKSKSKRDAQSIHSKKATKMDVQLTAHLTGLLNDADLYAMQVDDNSSLHSLPEYLNAIGLNINWKENE